MKKVLSILTLIACLLSTNTFAGSSGPADCGIASDALVTEFRGQELENLGCYYKGAEFYKSKEPYDSYWKGRSYRLEGEVSRYNPNSSFTLFLVNKSKPDEYVEWNKANLQGQPEIGTISWVKIADDALFQKNCFLENISAIGYAAANVFVRERVLNCRNKYLQCRSVKSAALSQRRIGRDPIVIINLTTGNMCLK